MRTKWSKPTSYIWFVFVVFIGNGFTSRRIHASLLSRSRGGDTLPLQPPDLATLGEFLLAASLHCWSAGLLRSPLAPPCFPRACGGGALCPSRRAPHRTHCRLDLHPLCPLHASRSRRDSVGQPPRCITFSPHACICVHLPSSQSTMSITGRLLPFSSVWRLYSYILHWLMLFHFSWISHFLPRTIPKVFAICDCLEMNPVVIGSKMQMVASSLRANC